MGGGWCLEQWQKHHDRPTILHNLRQLFIEHIHIVEVSEKKREFISNLFIFTTIAHDTTHGVDLSPGPTTPAPAYIEGIERMMMFIAINVSEMEVNSREEIF